MSSTVAPRKYHSLRRRLAINVFAFLFLSSSILLLLFWLPYTQEATRQVLMNTSRTLFATILRQERLRTRDASQSLSSLTLLPSVIVNEDLTTLGRLIGDTEQQFQARYDGTEMKLQIHVFRDRKNLLIPESPPLPAYLRGKLVSGLAFYNESLCVLTSLQVPGEPGGTVVSFVRLTPEILERITKTTGMGLSLFAGQHLLVSSTPPGNPMQVSSRDLKQIMKDGMLPRFFPLWRQDGLATPTWAAFWPDVNEKPLTASFSLWGTLLRILQFESLACVISLVTALCFSWLVGSRVEEHVASRLRHDHEKEMTFLSRIYRETAETLRQNKIQVEEEKQKVETILRSIPEGVVVLDHQGIILLWSHGAESITGYTAQEAQGKVSHEILSFSAIGKEGGQPELSDDQAAVETHASQRANGGSWKLSVPSKQEELFLKTRNGAIVPVVISTSSMSKIPPQAGSKISKISEISEIPPKAGLPQAGPPQAGPVTSGSAGSSHDGSKPHDGSEPGEGDGNPATHDRVILVFSDISKIKEVEKLKEEFMTVITHDLRSPLSAMMGYAGLILDPRVSPGEEEKKKYAQAIVKSGKSLMTLINNLLQSAKLEAGKMTFLKEPFPLRYLAAEVVEMLHPLAESKGISLQQDVEDLDVIGDRERIREVLVNLVSNAIKFTPSGKKIVVTAREKGEGRATRSEVEISVVDEGAGIPREQLSSFFEKFVSGTKEGGTGLGLYIAKKIVEAHGGTITARSKVDEGTTVTFTLPLHVRGKKGPVQMSLFGSAEKEEVLLV